MTAVVAAVGLLPARVGLLPTAVGAGAALGELLGSAVLLRAASGLWSAHAGSVSKGTAGLAAIVVSASREVAAILAGDGRAGTLAESAVAISEVALTAAGPITAVEIAGANADGVGEVATVEARAEGVCRNRRFRRFRRSRRDRPSRRGR